MTEKMNPQRDPDLKPERDDMENQGAANPEEVAEAEEDDEIDEE